MKKKAPEAKVPAMPKMDLIAVSAEATTLTAEGSSVLDMIKRTAVNTPENYKWAAQSVAEIKETRERMESERRKAVDPLGIVVKLINGWFKPGITALDAAEALLKQKMVEYARLAEKKRTQFIAAAGASSSQKERVKLLDKADDNLPPEIEGISTRQTWTGEVVDADKIPRTWLIPDEKALRAHTRSKGGDPKIPGWRAFPNDSLAVDIEKVKG